MSEEARSYSMPLIGDKAPEFTALTTQGTVNFPEDFKGKWVLFFSHPSDFTPVCTTEFMTLASMEEEFKAINTQLIGLSVDSLYSHIAWIRKIEELEWNGISKPKINFPVIADLNMKVSTKYGMLQPNVSSTQAVRAVFIIDPESVIRAIIYYPLTTGRNFDEIRRAIVALQKQTRSIAPHRPAGFLERMLLFLRQQPAKRPNVVWQIVQIMSTALTGSCVSAKNQNN